MSWIKDNKFIVALGGGTLAGAAALVFWGMQGSSRYQAAKDEFDAAAAEAAGFESQRYQRGVQVDRRLRLCH